MTWWALLDRATPTRLLLGGLALTGLFLSKASAALVVPMLVVLLIVRVARGRPGPFPGGVEWWRFRAG